MTRQRTEQAMELLSINILDMVAVAVLMLSAVLAFFRGFVHEILSIAAWVGAALGALYGLPYVRPKAHQLIPVPVVADAAGAMVIFLLLLLILSVITRALSKRVQGSALNSMDRSLGFLFGLLRGAVILSLAYVVMSWAIPDPQARPEWIRAARSAPLMESGGDFLRSLMPTALLGGEDRARAAVVEARKKAWRAIESKETYDRLIQPRPSAAPQAHPGVAGVPAADEPAGDDAGPGYDEKTRRTLDRLIQSQQ